MTHANPAGSYRRSRWRLSWAHKEHRAGTFSNDGAEPCWCGIVFALGADKSVIMTDDVSPVKGAIVRSHVSFTAPGSGHMHRSNMSSSSALYMSTFCLTVPIRAKLSDM